MPLAMALMLPTPLEPINPEAWRWFHDVVGGGRCAVVDTYWQTETGACIVSGIPGATNMKPGAATKPFFGIDAKVVNNDGTQCAPGQSGHLVIDAPWPGIARTVYRDHARYKKAYFADFPGRYYTGALLVRGASAAQLPLVRACTMRWNLHAGSSALSLYQQSPCLRRACSGTCSLIISTPRALCTVQQPRPSHSFPRYPPHTGDGAVADADGDIRILGRLDDVLNVSGHRIGSAEVEAALGLHPAIAESAVVGVPHAIKGEGIYAFVVLRGGHSWTPALGKEITATVRAAIGAIVSPDVLHPTPDLPKTRSGKIMRRMLRKVGAGETDVALMGDTSTLADPSVLERLIASRALYAPPPHKAA